MDKPHIQVEIELHHRMAKMFLGEAIMAIQELCRVSAQDMAAIIGQELGDMFACANCKMEKRENISEDHPAFHPYKQTLLLNFEVQYNNHRAKHERQECKKPEPKIV